MAEHWAFLTRLRHDLGKSYSVAQEHGDDPRDVNVVVLRQRRDETLTVATTTRWLALLMHENQAAARVEYKHLAVLIRHFFANPDALPSRTFAWPGTQESREELRRTLNPRRRTVQS